MEIHITSADAGKTILTLARRDLGFSSALLKKLKFTEGGILVNGAFVTVRYVLKEGDVLSFAMDDTEDDVSPYIVPAPLTLPVLFEDSEITAVNKPPDMPAHPSFGHRLDTVANALAYRYSERPYVFRPVNRLDRDTSGVMLTANTKLAAFRMAAAMQTGQIHKTYVAILHGKLPEKEGVITDPIRRTAESIITRETCSPDAPGAHTAETRYRVLAQTEGYTAVAAYPITGRTHQIRVHFTAHGCPLVGDDLYGAPSEWIARHALHAAVTVFPHPSTGEVVTVRAPLPDDMRALITALFASDADAVFAEVEKLC
ncbi:MAG: RluA family pseudouridine synthase [Clostridia bacterium]|nr:RluA family pseudouridine synthase [Clostridia bacterium]